MSELKKQGASQQKLSPSQANQRANDTINLIELFYRLLSQWKLILVALVIGALLAGILSFFVIQPKYTAKSTIYVLSNKDSVINMSDLQVGSALTYDYQKVFDMWEVHQRVLTKLGLNYSYTKMQNMVSVTNTSNTRMLDISVTSTDPQEAAAIANAYAEVASEYIAQNMATDQPSIMSRALTPSSPSSPNKAKNVILGALVGFLLAVGVITVLFLLDDKIRTADDVMKYTGMINLAVIPTEEGHKPSKKEAIR